jgi:RES domain-containing protein
MELSPAIIPIHFSNTHRLIPSRFPPAGILDLIATPEDLPYVIELENWTNDRISTELGVLNTIPKHEWVVGFPNATAIMAAFCHPYPTGGRFNTSARGAWYTAREFETALEETIFHRTKELAEIGEFNTRLEMRQYLSDLDTEFHDLRPSPEFDSCHDPSNYTVSQRLAEELLASQSNGVIYRSVRRAGGECIACFRPKLVLNVRPAAHFEYVWDGRPRPIVRQLAL